MITWRLAVENAPLSPRTPLSPVGRLPAYGKLAFGHLPTGLGKPLRGFPQSPSFDDDLSLLPMHISNCRHCTNVVDAGQFEWRFTRSDLNDLLNRIDCAQSRNRLQAQAA
jgi:hypothetical protein